MPYCLVVLYDHWKLGEEHSKGSERLANGNCLNPRGVYLWTDITCMEVISLYIAENMNALHAHKVKGIREGKGFPEWGFGDSEISVMAVI